MGPLWVARERLPEPTAFALGTVDSTGRPSVRILLLKAVDEQGFVEDAKTYSSGDDFPVEGRATKLLQLTAGSQAKARQESWKKRQVEVPRSEKPEAIAWRRSREKEAAAPEQA